MNIESIYQNADVTSQSATGEINKVAISYDECKYLTSLSATENDYLSRGGDLIEMDYHGEFIPLIEGAKLSLSKRKEG